MRKLYVQLDVDFPDNPRIIAAGEKAEVLYTRALCLAKRTLSDGFISTGQLTRLGLTGAQARANALVREQLWEEAPGGYFITGWFERNRSAKEIEDQSEARRVAGRQGGVLSGKSRRGEAKTKQVASDLLQQ